LDATQLINHKNAILVDVRDVNDYREGHIINALHIPLADLDSHGKKLEKYKEKALITYCRSGQRSATACARLQKQGFTSVYNLRGGVMAWQKDNLPLTRE
jgi:rhodanese-related sulfurtransferase